MSSIWKINANKSLSHFDELLPELKVPEVSVQNTVKANVSKRRALTCLSTPLSNYNLVYIVLLSLYYGFNLDDETIWSSTWKDSTYYEISYR